MNIKNESFIKALFAVILFLFIVMIIGFIYINSNIKSIAETNKNFVGNNNFSNYVKENVPILMYHDFVNDPEKITDVSININKFKKDLEYLVNNGYEAIFFQDLFDYVYYGDSLPDKPILITMDDGYLSNYTLAFPILKELNVKATIFVVGISMLESSDYSYPHFDYMQGREMIRSGLVDIQSHTFNLHIHTYYGFDRNGATKIENESYDEFYSVIENDCRQMENSFVRYLNKKPFVFAYPYGETDQLTEELLEQMGYKITVVSHNRDIFSYIQYNNPKSLYNLKRISIDNDTILENILKDYDQ